MNNNITFGFFKKSQKARIMRNTVLLVLLTVSISAYSQVDTIFKMNGDKLLINVVEIGETSIKYTFPNESFSNTIARSTVTKIHFKSGRVQEFASALNVSVTKSCVDWENVQISNIESEVVGLQKIDLVGAKAKGTTTLASISKLQDRAFNKIKMTTAMRGGNVAYIVSINTEDAMSGGKFSSSKTASVTISGTAYTTKKVFKHEISFGSYKISNVYIMRTNAFGYNDASFKEEKLVIREADMFEKNGFQNIKLNVLSIPKVTDYTVIYADDEEMVLSGVKTTKQGKTTYYNVILKK